MTLSFENLLVILAALVGLFSPFANIGPFASLIGHFPRSDQRKIAFGVFINVLIVLLIFVWAGQIIFEILGVSSEYLSVTGGIALMIAGLPMMLGTGKKDVDESDSSEVGKDEWRSIVVVPMTFPMSVGGTTAAYVVTASSYAKYYIDMLAISIVIVIFSVIIWLTHFLSPPLASRLNPLGREILNRVGGIILVTIAVQLLAGGLKGLFPILAG
jgi:multiple antibiotic resistance protein